MNPSKIFKPQAIWRSALLLSLAAVSFGTAFRSAPNTAKSIPNSDEEWVLATTQDSVECYYKIADCKGDSKVLIRFNNQNSFKVAVKWTEVYETQLEEEANSLATEKQLIVEPGYTPDINCESADGVTVTRVLLALPAYPAKVQKVTFSNLQITSN